MKADDLEKKVKDLTKTVKKMKAKERALEEIEAIKKLQRAYGYYLEHWEEEQIVGLFSHDPEVSVEINDSGLYKGYEAVKNSFNTITKIQ